MYIISFTIYLKGEFNLKKNPLYNARTIILKISVILYY